MSKRLIVNGVNGATGKYLEPFKTVQEIAGYARRESWGPDHLSDLRNILLRAKLGPFSPVYGVQIDNLAQTGWGVIFAENADPAIREALEPLLSHRKNLATQKHENYYREFIGETAYKAGESKRDFLVNRGANASGPVKPKNMPFYLLIVGDPEHIPLSFQYELDIAYSVGRIHFDHIEDYANYARNVVDAESGKQSPNRRATFFGVKNRYDHMTDLSTKYLVQPLARSIAEQVSGWTCETVPSDETTKAKLGELLGGESTPEFLFTASHGIAFPNGDPRKHSDQGALVCCEWPGMEAWQKPIPKEFYFSASDVSDDARLAGLIAFHFACYSAGTPNTNDFRRQWEGNSAEVSDRAFLSNLTKRLLSHPRGGALACIGHVDMAWGCSFLDHQYATLQLTVFEDSIIRILNGMPVGSALTNFNIRYSECSAELLNVIDESEAEPKQGESDEKIADLWMVNHDSRNYVIIGDPAVRLPKQ